jgi:two-component system, sensor histidine kinase and response regulator
VIDELAAATNTQRPIEFKVHSLTNTNGDKSMLKQVWTNLISNAIKYSSKKEKAVVQVDSWKENGNIIYSVKDNGAGFDMKYYDKLFGVFQRLHKAEQFDGTGVGLAIVDRIVSKHAGKVWAEAKPDEGATFFFSLPAN